MVVGIQTTEHSHTFVGGRAPGPGTGSLTLLSPLDGLATVAANVVTAYRTAEAVKTDHGDGSLLHVAAPYARLHVARFRAGAFADATTAVLAARTFGDASVLDTGTIDAGDIPIYELTSASLDGTAFTRLLYTEQDPTGVTLDDSDDGEIWINTKTGVFQASRSTSGAGAGIVLDYKVADIDPLLDQVLMQPAEVISFAGWRYNAQYFGMFDYLNTWCVANRLVWFAGLDDSVAKADAKPVVEAIRSENAAVVAAKLTTPADDLTVAYAAKQAASPPNGTMKGQAAPRLAYSRTLPYTRTEFGDDLDPTAGTFHNFGANVVTLHNNAFALSSDRAMTDYAEATDVLFVGAKRTLYATMALIDAEVNGVLTASPTSALFDRQGLAAVKAAIQGALTRAQQLRYIEEATLDFPELEDTLSADRKKRALQGVAYTVRISGVIHTVHFSAEVLQ